MLTREEDVDAHALRRQGWTISAIARHLGRDRKTIRAYLNGERTAGRRRQAPDAFVPFLPYCRQRLADDPHLWASTLFGHASTGRNVAVIAHPPGEEIQFDRPLQNSGSSLCHTGIRSWMRRSTTLSCQAHVIRSMTPLRATINPSRTCQ
ncbi:terminase gpP N-terminus-related DNA-binding protein [Streptomyces lydicus]